MSRSYTWVCVSALAAALALLACDQTGLGPFVNDPNDNTNSPANDPPPGGGIEDPADDPTTGSTRPDPPAVVVARVRNESNSRGDVTIRSLIDDTVSHLAFVRILPLSITSITSPVIPDTLEVSGVTDRGVALEEAVFRYGIDFDESRPAIYIIPTSVDDEPVTPLDAVLSLTMVEPATDVTLTLGSSLTVRWEDEITVPATVVRMNLRSVDGGGSSALLRMGPEVGATLDGVADELVIVLEGIEPGAYEVVGEIDDGTNVVTAVAAGLVEVILPDENRPPTLTILFPTSLVQLSNGDQLTIEWVDEDPDDNALITFSLAVSDPSVVGVGPFVFSPSVAEDPDGSEGDSLTVTLSGVLPGLYDLVGEIDDGALKGTDRLRQMVRVINYPPQLSLAEPAVDFDVEPGGSFLVTWTDADDNDNAQISLYLDPGLAPGAPDGDEILLASLIGEDPDGADDRLIVSVPAWVEDGAYRVVGKIWDGLVEIIAWAPGTAYVVTGPPELNFVAPTGDVWTRLGEGFSFNLHAANVPANASWRFYLSNVPFGGDLLRVDVTPDPVETNQLSFIPLDTLQALIPNAAWPRQFELQAELSVGQELYSAKAGGSVWIRQEVEIADVETVNCDCHPDATPIEDERSFIGFRITYYGGGFSERERRDDVTFWLSDDGTVPPDFVGDLTHQILVDALASPNAQSVAQGGLIRLVVALHDSDGTLSLRLTPGEYFIVPVLHNTSFGSVPSGPSPQPVEVCFCLPGGSDR